MEKSQALQKFEEWLISIGATNSDWRQHKYMLKQFIAEYESGLTEESMMFELFLDSIGGLESAYRSDIKIKNRYFFEVGDGWLPMIQKLIEDLVALGWNKQVSQVKEKFGGLRFYIGGATDEMWNLIEKAEHQSYRVCEQCGDEGVLRVTIPGRWYFTACQKCADNRKNAFGEKVESSIASQ